MLNDEFIKELLNIKLNQKQFDFFDILPPKEVLISKWLDFILNPNINGVGNKPIQILLNLSESNYNLYDYEFELSDTELCIDNMKRIDIILKFKGLWIVIENKIDSLENGEQTNDYYNYIEKTRGENEAIYIYLKPNYNRSNPINKNFIIVTYDKLINGLKEINYSDYSDKNKFKYLNEFIISGGRFMKNEEIEINEAVTFYVKEMDRFLAIEEEYNNKNRLLLDKIMNDTLSYLNEYFTSYNSYRFSNWIQFYKNNWDNEKHNGVHFEVIFKDYKIIGRKMMTSIVLHIENHITVDKLDKFKFIDITKGKNSNQAYLKNEEIKSSFELSFVNNNDIEESINIIKNEVFKLVQRYEKLIDATMN